MVQRIRRQQMTALGQIAAFAGAGDDVCFAVKTGHPGTG